MPSSPGDKNRGVPIPACLGPIAKWPLLKYHTWKKGKHDPPSHGSHTKIAFGESYMRNNRDHWHSLSSFKYEKSRKKLFFRMVVGQKNHWQMVVFPNFSQMSSKVVLQQILLFVLYPAAACGGATKQRETFHLPSNLFAAPPLPPGRKQIGRWWPPKTIKTDICAVWNDSSKYFGQCKTSFTVSLEAK